MELNAETLPIVVGVDGSDESLAALKRASDLSSALNVPLHVVTVWQFPVTFDGTFSSYSPEDDAKFILDASIVAVFDGNPPAQLIRRVVAGPVASALIDESRTASMLVVGSRGRGGFSGLLLGSVSTACAQHGHCPVLVIHGSRKPRDLAPHEHEEALV